MKRKLFVKKCLPLAQQAGNTFGLNPVVILAQAALESGWGTSRLAIVYHNYFGITAAGPANDYWSGTGVESGSHGLRFRRYGEPLQSFMDYGRLLKVRYPIAAEMSFHPEAFAREMAYSAYISEQNGDNRESYRKALVSISKTIASYLPS